MKNLKDAKTTIYPPTTRRGKELPSSSALDSPSVLSKLATPTHAIGSDRSHVIDDATSTMHDTYDETTSVLDTTVPLNMNCMLFLRVMLWMKKLIETFLLAMIGVILTSF